MVAVGADMVDVLDSIYTEGDQTATPGGGGGGQLVVISLHVFNSDHTVSIRIMSSYWSFTEPLSSVLAVLHNLVM